MINKYAAYDIWERNPDGTYWFRCVSDKRILPCRDCPFNNTVLCSPIMSHIPTWNRVRKIMQEVYGA